MDHSSFLFGHFYAWYVVSPIMLLIVVYIAYKQYRVDVSGPTATVNKYFSKRIYDKLAILYAALFTIMVAIESGEDIKEFTSRDGAAMLPVFMIIVGGSLLYRNDCFSCWQIRS